MNGAPLHFCDEEALRAMTKRILSLLLSCLMLCAAALAEEAPAPMDTLAAIVWAQAFLEREEIAGYSGLPMNVTRDDDCWVCEVGPSEWNTAGYRLVFDDTGRIHLFQNLLCSLPELPAQANDWAAGMTEAPDALAAGRMGEVLAALEKLLTETRGSSFEALGIAAAAEVGVYLLSLDLFEAYALVDLRGDGLAVLAYGDLTVSHGAYPGCISQAEAVAAARQASQEKYGLSATDVHLIQATFEPSDPERFVVEEGGLPLPYWFVAFSDNPDPEQGGQYFFALDARTGGLLFSTDPAHGGNG